MKKSSGKDLMRFNGDNGTNGGARKPSINVEEEYYKEDLYTDFTVQNPAGGFNDNVAGNDFYDDGKPVKNVKSKKKQGLNKAQLLMIIGMVILAGVAVVCGWILFNPGDGETADIKNDVIIEIGSPITIDIFFDKKPSNARFLTDISGIDTSQPAAYQLKIGYGRDQEADVILRIEDHTGPTGEVVPVTVYLNWKMPEAAECLTNLYDVSGVAKIAYQEGTPKFSAGGTYDVPVAATDVYGNTTVFLVPFTIVDDNTPPVIKGVHDLVLDGNPDQLDFYAGVTATDDTDPSPIIKVDDSAVDYTKAGTYDLVYRAIDKAGNIGTVKAKLTVKMPTEEVTNKSATSGDNGSYHVGDGDPYAMAANIVSGLMRGSDVETARAIFNWVHDKLWFKMLWGTPNYEDAAYRGFTLHSGDCYVYYACCKMLLDAAGIPNMRVDRSPAYNGNIHFWLLVQLNGEWYHCDATEGYNDHPGIWFMCTDDEINDRYHQFNGALYPERAGGSKEFKASPTPSPSSSPSPSVSPSVTPSPSPSITGEPSPTVTTTPADNSPTPAPEITNTPVPTDTPAPTPEPTATPVPTEEPVNTPEITNEPETGEEQTV